MRHQEIQKLMYIEQELEENYYDKYKEYSIVKLSFQRGLEEKHIISQTSEAKEETIYAKTSPI